MAMSLAGGYVRSAAKANAGHAIRTFHYFGFILTLITFITIYLYADYLLVNVVYLSSKISEPSFCLSLKMYLWEGKKLWNYDGRHFLIFYTLEFCNYNSLIKLSTLGTRTNLIFRLLLEWVRNIIYLSFIIEISM